MEAPWTLSARPCSAEEDEQALLASLSYSELQYGSQLLQLAILPSTNWTAADLAKLGTLVQSRNRFVCMQLVTMVKEQYDKVKAAESSGDAAALHSAQFMYLALVTVAETNEVVAAGLFYPRSCSKDQVDMPHMYVELLCCNSPGKGYGTVLLQHIEQFTAGCCDYLSAGFFGFLEPNKALTVGIAGSSSPDSSTVTIGAERQPGSTGIVLPLVALGAPVPAGALTAACCSACSGDSTITGLGDCCLGASVLSLHLQKASNPALQAQPIDIPTSAVNAAGIIRDATDATVVLGSSASSAGSLCSKKLSSPAKRIQGIKLLSVASAQSFYERNGYGAPDVCKEMFKPLISCSKKVGLGDAGSVAASSCGSIAMSIC